MNEYFITQLPSCETDAMIEYILSLKLNAKGFKPPLHVDYIPLHVLG